VQVAKAAPATADVLSEQIEGAAQRVAEEAPKAADRATKQIEVRSNGF
jgi:cell division septum initiation protein DivIVA